MKLCKKMLVVIGCLGVMIGAVGCASNDVVKKDESIAGKEVTTKPITSPNKTKSATTVQKNDESKKMIAPASTVSNQQPVKKAELKTELEKIYFNFDSADLSKDATEKLSHNANILLNARNDAKLRIEGNCDERGSAEYNLALGERRAIAAANYLKTMGVKAERISVISYGKERPAIQGNDETAWSKNRRDEFVIQ